MRTQETGLGNWIADVLLHSFAESGIEGNGWVEKDGKHPGSRNTAAGGADAVIICGGSLRGDSQYGPGKITLGDILGKKPLPRMKAEGLSEILPFEDPVVCIEVSIRGTNATFSLT